MKGGGLAQTYMAVYYRHSVLALHQDDFSESKVQSPPKLKARGGVCLERSPTVIILSHRYIKMILVNPRIQLGSRSSKGRAA